MCQGFMFKVFHNFIFLPRANCQSLIFSFSKNYLLRVCPMPQRLLRRHVFSILLLSFVVFVHCSAEDSTDQNIVAKVGDRYAISTTELQNYVRDYNYGIFYRRNIAEGYNKALESIIVKRLKIIDFFNRGLGGKKELFKSIRRSINEELAIKYTETRFLEKKVDDQSIQKVYREMGREVVFQRTTLPKDKNHSVQHTDSLKMLANEIKTKLDAGTDVDGIRNKYSTIAVLSDINNRMLTMNWKLSLSNTVNSTIFNIPAGESRILEDKQAYYIVKVFEIKTNKVPPLENVKDEIRKALEGKHKSLDIQDFDNTKKSFIDEKTVKWNQQSINQILTWSAIPGFFQRNYSDTLRYAISHGRNFLILKYSGGKVDLKEFLRLLDEILILGNYSSIKEENLKSFILEAVRTNIIVNKAIKLNLEKEIVNPGTTNPIIKKEIVRLYDQQVIDSRIPPATRSALQHFYNENKDSLYYQLAKVNIYAIIDSNKNTLDELKLKLSQNVQFEKLASVLSVKTFIKDRKGIIKSHFSMEPPFLGRVAFELALNEIAGPVEYNDPEKGRQYALIKCINRQEEKQLTYHDAEKTIADDFVNHYRKIFSLATEEQLKKKYNVIIYQDVLRNALLSSGKNPQQ
jgi:hypothetical protein